MVTPMIRFLKNRLGHIERDPATGKPVASSAGRFMGWNTIYGRDGDHGEPYMTRIWFGRLRLHIFHKGDQDPDHHDHPWAFWTFPLTSYVEEVVRPLMAKGVRTFGPGEYEDRGAIRRQIVPAWRWTFRPATHTHRVLGRAWPGMLEHKNGHFISATHGNTVDAVGPAWRPGKIITLVWRGKAERPWGFLKNRDGKWCWVAWREYVFGGGKSAPCE